MGHKFSKFILECFAVGWKLKNNKHMFSKISGSLRKIEFSYCSIATNIEGNLLKPGTIDRGFLESQSNSIALQFYEIVSDY